MCSCRGIYFSLDQADVQLLLDAPNDREVLRIIQEDIEARWDEENLLLLDKSWDAIHRCLTDGTLTCKQKNIKEKVIIGGRQLYKGSAYIISLKTSSEVQEIVESLQKINKQWFSEKFYGLRKKRSWFTWATCSDYEGPLDKNDFEASWEYFKELRCFFEKASQKKLSIIFLVDQ
ncbi:MAG: DUF1877 family protein [Candidatus Electrothrix aestuarii]|uniref:DUF1877 family protein n=1 Tax=Candidatus Electrothrix aestuarii TaxID=3062594 RepID=A0AAU8LS01_9BACT|nr:DUF1877 family protein [Candidatus Electrothrix aestuarii]